VWWFCKNIEQKYGFFSKEHSFFDFSLFLHPTNLKNISL